jgi:hypothetical protein
MYHDEFASKPAWVEPTGDVPAPGFALEFGGGLSLGLAASLNQPISTILFYLGGLLPLVVSCLAIAAYRCSELLARLAPLAESSGRRALPSPYLATIPSDAVVGPYRRRFRANSARSMLNTSDRMGPPTR